MIFPVIIFQIIAILLIVTVISVWLYMSKLRLKSMFRLQTVDPGVIGKGVAGEDYDPYADQLEDDFYYNPGVLLCTIIGFVYKPALKFRAYFPPHNYRQWHILELSLTEGWNGGAIKAGIVPSIPTCPKLWQDVKHYWNFGCIVGIIAYECAAYSRVLLILVCLSVLVNSGDLSAADAAKLILPQIGVII